MAIGSDRSVGGRLSLWWERSIWGWLVILGPMTSYAVLIISMDVFGLGASDPVRFLPPNGADAFRSPSELTLYGIAGRLEYALVCAVFFLVATFSIIWSLPRIAAAYRNPFGGVLGLTISLGSSAFLYWLYIESDYNLRQVFADDLLALGESEGLIPPIRLNLSFFGVDIAVGETPQTALLAASRDVIYFLGNAAPWCLIVLAARYASFEPRTFAEETPASLRSRIAALQIAVVLAAANIVLSVAYTRAMTYWPPSLLDPEFAGAYAAATSRYVALWGAIGSVLLATALAPAYVSLHRQLDRVALRELAGDSGRRVTYQERYEWRVKHGLVVSAQQAIAAGAAVVAPILTGPALEATYVGDAETAAQELVLDAR